MGGASPVLAEVLLSGWDFGLGGLLLSRWCDSRVGEALVWVELLLSGWDMLWVVFLLSGWDIGVGGATLPWLELLQSGCDRAGPVLHRVHVLCCNILAG